ncbi:MAG: DUF3592 domain-containing protein [Chloroflexota bacterium]
MLGQAKRSFWLLFGGIWLLAGLVMLVVAIGMALQERQWGAEAVRTTGIVLTKDIIPADSDSSTEYRVRFRFTTQDEVTVEGSQEVEVGTWEELTEREPVEIYYLPSSPSSARLEPAAGLFMVVIFFLFGAVFGGIGGVLVVRAVRGLFRARDLLRSGVDAEATVTRVEQTNVSFNRRLQFRVHYRYRDQQGGGHEGDSGYLEWEEASIWNEGDRVAIRYDPIRPAQSLWVGRIEAPSPAVDAAPPD